jgi:hypothetical protein
MMPRGTPKPDSTNHPYSVLTFKGAQAKPDRHWYTDPITALSIAVEYLKGGYQVRLSDGCVEWFSHQPMPDDAERAVMMANGQAAAFTGPPLLAPAAPPATFKDAT